MLDEKSFDSVGKVESFDNELQAWRILASCQSETPFASWLFEGLYSTDIITEYRNLTRRDPGEGLPSRGLLPADTNRWQRLPELQDIYLLSFRELCEQ